MNANTTVNMNHAITTETQNLSSHTHRPHWGKGVGALWLRNFLYFRHTFTVSIIWSIFEPLLFMLAIGYGVGAYMNNINGVPYRIFYFPALMSSSGMLVAFLEGAYGSYNKLVKQNTYLSILVTPIEPNEIVLGEILWSTSKGMFSSICLALVGLTQGLVETWFIVPALLVVFMLCWLSASFGVLLATFAKNYDLFTYIQSGFMVPMSLFSETYFPLNNLPSLFQYLAYLSPLFHAVNACRFLLSGDISSIVFLHMGVLFALAFLISNWAIYRMSQRIFY